MWGKEEGVWKKCAFCGKKMKNAGAKKYIALVTLVSSASTEAMLASYLQQLEPPFVRFLTKLIAHLKYQCLSYLLLSISKLR